MNMNKEDLIKLYIKNKPDASAEKPRKTIGDFIASFKNIEDISSFMLIFVSAKDKDIAMICDYDTLQALFYELVDREEISVTNHKTLEEIYEGYGKDYLMTLSPDYGLVMESLAPKSFPASGHLPLPSAGHVLTLLHQCSCRRAAEYVYDEFLIPFFLEDEDLNCDCCSSDKSCCRMQYPFLAESKQRRDRPCRSL